MIRGFLQAIARKKAAGGASDDFAVLATYTPSAVSSVDVDWSSFDTDHDQFELYITGVDVSDDGAQLTLQGLFSGSPETGTVYDEHLIQPDSSASTYAGDANTGATSGLATSPIGNAYGESASAVVTVYNPTSASLNKTINIDGAGLDASADCIMGFNGLIIANTAAMDGLRIAVTSGTFTCKILLVGRVNP